MRASGEPEVRDCFALATDLAEVLVLESGLDFRQAHRLVGHLVRGRLAGGDLNQLTPGELAAAAVEVLGQRVEISQAALRNALDPEAAVAARTAPGGAAPEALETMLVQCEQALAEVDAWTSNCRRRLRMAEDSLLRTAHECLQGLTPSAGRGVLPGRSMM